MKQGLRILGERASIQVYDAPVVEDFVQLHQQAGLVDHQGRVRVLQPNGGNAARQAIHRRLRQLELRRRHRLDFCQRPGLEHRSFLGRDLGIECPHRGGIDAEAAADALARTIGEPVPGQIRTAVGQPGRRPARWQQLDRVLRGFLLGAPRPGKARPRSSPTRGRRRRNEGQSFVVHGTNPEVGRPGAARHPGISWFRQRRSAPCRSLQDTL